MTQSFLDYINTNPNVADFLGSVIGAIIALIAAFIALLGVLLTIIKSNKALSKRLDFDKKQNEKNRNIDLIKEIYLNTLDSISKTLLDIESYSPSPNVLKNKNRDKFFDKIDLSGSREKIHLVVISQIIIKKSPVHNQIKTVF